MMAMAQALRTALLDFVWQGLVVALLLWVALYLSRRQRPQARYAASCTALALLMALPVATAWRAYRVPSAAAAVGPFSAEPIARGNGFASASARQAIDWAARVEPWALPVWSAGVLFFSLRLVWGCRRVSAMRRRGSPADAAVMATVASLAGRMGLLRPVRVLTAALPDGPSVAGWLRPVLLLPPAAVLGLSPEQLEAVLAHELAHICRYDHLVNAAQGLVETLLFYHPAVWWTSARIREERELCCDDMAVRACGDALCFARALTRLERLRVVAPSAALGSTGGSLTYRVQRLIGAGRQDCAPSKLSGILAFSLGVAALALNVHWAKGQERSTERGLAVVFTPRVEGDGNGVSVDLGGAAVLHRSWVEYPESARDKGIQGTVAVEVTLDGDGNVSDAHVVSGPMQLRRTVMSSIFDWHFTRDSAGSNHVVSVTFGKATVAADTRQNRVLIWNPLPAATETSGETGLAVTRSSGDNPVDEGGDRVLQLRRALEEERSRLQSEPETVRGETRDQIRHLEAELRTAQGARSEDSRYYFFAGEPTHEGGPMPGRTIKAIEVVGLSDTAKSDLISRLPLHVGDTISPGSLDVVRKVVNQFDEHLEFQARPLENLGASIRISAPGHEK
jgi:TonB family protein